jgi:hypothetical protein
MYIVIKTVRKNGREYQYRYEQISYRVGKRVKTKSRYLGPVGKVLSAIGGLIEANRTRGPIIDEGAMLKAEKDREAKHAAMLERFYAETGLRVGPDNPVPTNPAPAPTSNEVENASPESDSANSKT